MLTSFTTINLQDGRLSEDDNGSDENARRCAIALMTQAPLAAAQQ